MKKVICAVIIVIMAFTCGCSNKKTYNDNITVSFNVVDGVTGLPLENVRIVLPEYDLTVLTSSNGLTDEVKIHALVDERSELSLKQNYGTFTALAFKETYNDFALFDICVHEEENRRIKLYMFAVDTPLGTGMPITMVESPDKEWTEQLIKKYK